jgi:sugar phosphate isomerase/epimerase
MTVTVAPRISAFPKCYLEDLVERRMDLLEWIRQAAALGAEGLELYDGFFPSTERGYLAEVKRALRETSQEVSMLCFSPDFTHPDPAARERELRRQEAAIDLAAELGAGFCRTLSGQRHPETGREEGVSWVVDSLRKAVRHAGQRGVVLAMENHYKDGKWRYPEFAQKNELFLEIIGRLDSPWFGVQYDPSNALMAGEDPLTVLASFKERVVTVHASDRYLAEGARLEDLREADGTIGYSPLLKHGETGKGLNDYDEIFRVLRSVGFRGWISIEDGMEGMEQMARSVAFLKEQRRRHYG